MGNLCMRKRKKSSITPDPLSGLTPKEIALIKASWFNLYKYASLKETGSLFFIKLFNEHPYMKDYFPIFVDKTRKVEPNPAFRAHVISVFCELSKYVDYANEPDILVALIEKRTRGHYLNGVTLMDMENISGSLLRFLEDRLSGMAYIDEAIQAWTKFLNVHNVVFQKTYAELTMTSRVSMKSFGHKDDDSVL